jgi:hypothetical protein
MLWMHNSAELASRKSILTAVMSVPEWLVQQPTWKTAGDFKFEKDLDFGKVAFNLMLIFCSLDTHFKW